MKITFFAGLRHRLFNMLPYLAVSLLIWTVCVLSSFGGERETFFSVFTEAVGGVEHSGQFDLFGFFRYFGIFFAGLFLGMAGSVLNSETMPYFVLPRSKSFFKWWIKTVSSALLWCVLYCLTDSNLNHTGIYLYSKGKIMIHLTFDYKTDEKCTTPGQYLKYHRTFQGLSTRELAEKVGIVPATLVLYENDRHPIKHSTAVALANALGIDRNRLLDKYTAFVDYPYSSLLKKVRQDLSLTQIQMAELIGIGQTSYSGWEREIRVPRRKEYDKILAALEKLRVNVDTYLCQSASI